MMTMPRRSHAANRLGWIGLLLLLVSCIVLSAVTYQQLRSLRQSSEATRAQLLAQSAAQRLQHAVAVGIPLRELQGVKEFFQHRLNAHPDIQSISVVLADGTVLWHTQREQQPEKSAGVQSQTPIAVNGRQVASVQLQLRQSSVQAFARSTSLLLLPVIVLLSVLAWLAARFSEAQGVQLRNFATRLAIRSIRNGRYDRSFIINQRREFDLRVQGLGHATRNVHETLVRVRRLIASLRVTEPQLARRERLDQLLHHAEGNDHFSEHGLLQIRVVPAQAQAFWACLLATLSAVALPALLSHTLQADMSTLIAQLQLPVFLMGACAGALLPRGLQWRAVSVAMGACLLLCALGILWALSLLSGTPSFLVTQALCGLAGGAALHACLRVEEQPQQSQNTIAASPHWVAAAIGAWSLALLWLAPALATTTHEAIGLQLGAAALVMPAACCLVYLLRWNEPRSSWRVMPAREPGHELYARHTWPVIAWLSPTSLAACAIGVLAALPHASMSEEATYLISSALGLGLLAGLLMRSVARRKVALVIAMSAVFWVLHAVLPENSLLRHASACVAAASLGWCIACVLKAVSPKVALPVLRFLVPMTFGALLASAGIAVEMSTSLLALAAVALTAAAISRPSAIESPTLQAPSQGAGHAA